MIDGLDPSRRIYDIQPKLGTILANSHVGAGSAGKQVNRLAEAMS
jgi:hypothetical protein